MEKKINRSVIRTGETDIKVHLIDSFPNHPYHVFDDEDMTELAASIEANGLLNPIIVCLAVQIALFLMQLNRKATVL